MIVYDSECYPNVYLIGFADPDSRKYVAFEISDRKDDRDAIYEYCRNLYRNNTYMVGFNNIKYDYPLLDFILKNKSCNNDDIYKKSCSLISDETPYIKIEIPQLDLMVIHHMDNKAKMTSLKILEFNMRMDNIEELPFKPGTVLKYSEIDKLKKYMKHDIKATNEFLKRSQKQIDFRREISNKYRRNMMNHNDVRIGKDIFVDALIKAGVVMKNAQNEWKQTFRNLIHVKDILLPSISFRRKEFQDIHEQFKDLVIENTKGEFGISTEADGFHLDYGLGGLHGALNSVMMCSDDEYIVQNRDVSSYYPNLSIRNKLYPEHLGEKFCEVYEWIYNERKKYPKGSPENAAYKLALNGTFGASNSVYSPFYDPQFTMSITINGELLLSMLLEGLMAIESLQLIQVNTDGFMYRVKRNFLPEVDRACKMWETNTGLELETEEYSRIYIRDTNNYILSL